MRWEPTKPVLLGEAVGWDFDQSQCQTTGPQDPQRTDWSGNFFVQTCVCYIISHVPPSTCCQREREGTFQSINTSVYSWAVAAAEVSGKWSFWDISLKHHNFGQECAKESLFFLNAQKCMLYKLDQINSSRPRLLITPATWRFNMKTNGQPTRSVSTI